MYFEQWNTSPLYKLHKSWKAALIHFQLYKTILVWQEISYSQNIQSKRDSLWKLWGSGKGELGQNQTFLKLFNYWVTVMTFQHPEILEFLNSLRLTSKYEGYVRILWYNPWDITAAGYTVVWHFISSKCIIVIKIGISLTFWKPVTLKLFTGHRNYLTLPVISWWVKKNTKIMKKKIKRNGKENHTTIWPTVQTKCLWYHLTGKVLEVLSYDTGTHWNDRIPNACLSALASEV